MLAVSKSPHSKFPSVCILILLSLMLPGTAFVFAQPPQRPPIVPMNLSNLRIDFISVGARPAALGGAFIGAAQDETAAPINPAGLTYLKSVGVSLHQRRARFKFKEPERSFDNPDAKRNFHTSNFDQSMVTVFVPVKKVTFAIFRQVVFDSRFNFETRQFLTIDPPLTTQQALGGLGNFPGRKVDLDLEMVTDALSVAFELSKRISIGVTGKISVLNFKLHEQTFLDPQVTNGQLPGDNSAETTYSITSVDERNTEQNFSVGFMGKLIVDKLFFGAVYNFNPSFNLKSTMFLPEYKIDSENLTLHAESPENTTFKLSVPDTYGFGFYYVASSQLRFTFDVVRVEYSDLLSGNDLNVVADDLINSQGAYEDPDRQPDLTIDDATEFHFGLEYLYKSPKLGLIPLRFGVFTNPDHRIYAAAADPDLKRLYPKARSRIHYTFGLGVVLTNNLKFDGSVGVSNDGFEIIGSTLISIPF
ncbi:MAG: OmpP1/FadL family transporter [bacterium]